jgi:NitT/TauT family transport system permease protein
VPRTGGGPEGRRDRSAPRGGRRSGRRGQTGRATRAPWWVVVSLRLGLLGAVLGLWQVAAITRVIDPFFIGEPTRIFQQLVTWTGDGSIFDNIWVTVEEATIGFAISAVAGIGLGLLLARYELLDRVMYPFVNVLNTVPRFALAPLFLLWFGLGITGKIALVVSVALFNFLINTYSGAKEVDQESVKLVQLLGATPWEVTRYVMLPSLVPWIMSAMRFAVAYSLAAAVIAEIVGANQGIGYLIAYTSGLLQTNGTFAALGVLGLIAWLANTGIAQLERRLLRWQV